MIEDINELKVKVEKHGEEIHLLKSDMRVIGNTVSDLTNKVATLSTELHSLNGTIRDATTTLKTMVQLVKVFVGAITVAGSIVGLYLALGV